MKVFNVRRFMCSGSLLALICLTFVLGACGAAASGQQAAQATRAATKPTPTQPISAQRLLSGPVVYVALGASDAVGVGSSEPGAQGYVPLLAQRLPRGSHLVNLGVSGIHLHEALAQELPIALSTSPRLITIWLVTNDFVAGVPYQEYMQDLTTLLQRLRQGTQARIVMANLPDLTLLPAFARSSSQQKATMRSAIQRWNAQIAAIAARFTVTVVDLFSHDSQLTAHPEYISGDGFHPSPQGYVQLADLFWSAIAS